MGEQGGPGGAVDAVRQGVIRTRDSEHPPPGPRDAASVDQRVVVWGTGSIGSRHLEIIQRTPGVRPVAVPVRQARRSELEASGIETAASPEEIGAADAGIVATDTRRHVTDLQRLLECGVEAILVEKPVAASIEDLRALSDSFSRLARAQVFVGCCLRFNPGLRKFRELLPRVGFVHQVSIEARSYLPDWRPDRDYRDSYSARREAGGVLLDLIHEIDYAMWLFGRPKAVQGVLAHSGRLDIESEDQAQILWETKEGTRIFIGLDYLSRPPTRTARAYGEEGTLIWDGVANTVRLELQNGETESYQFEGSNELMYARQWDAFRSRFSGEMGEGELALLQEGVDAVAVCDAVKESSKSLGEEVPRWTPIV